MDGHTRVHRHNGFALGLLTGTCLGAGLAMWLAPRLATEVREHVTDTAKRLAGRASGTAGEIARKGRRVRDDVAGAVARGAHEVERYATAARSDGGSEGGKHPAV